MEIIIFLAILALQFFYQLSKAIAKRSRKARERTAAKQPSNASASNLSSSGSAPKKSFLLKVEEALTSPNRKSRPTASGPLQAQASTSTPARALDQKKPEALTSDSQSIFGNLRETFSSLYEDQEPILAKGYENKEATYSSRAGREGDQSKNRTTTPQIGRLSNAFLSRELSAKYSLEKKPLSVTEARQKLDAARAELRKVSKATTYQDAYDTTSSFDASEDDSSGIPTDQNDPYKLNDGQNYGQSSATGPSSTSKSQKKNSALYLKSVQSSAIANILQKNQGKRTAIVLNSIIGKPLVYQDRPERFWT